MAIGGKKDRFACREGLPPGILNQGFTFTMVTPDREFYLSAETETERKQWMEALQALVNNPVNPQDYDKSNWGPLSLTKQGYLYSVFMVLLKE